jgi:S1-C subfamily serine protease
MTSTVAEPDRGPTDSAELDAYSRVVTSVAAELTASVAALQHSERTSSGRVEGGAGSAVVFTDDGFLLTNAHVVGNATSGGTDLSSTNVRRRRRSPRSRP